MSEGKVTKRNRKVQEFYKSFGEPSGDELIAYLIHRLEVSTRWLIVLTTVLAILTIVLALMMGIDIWG